MSADPNSKDVNPPTESPYHELASILHKLFLLAAEADRLPESEYAPPTFDRVVSTTKGWSKAKSLARRTSVGHGIYLDIFYPVLTEAEEILQELTQIAVGNKSVPFSLFDMRYIKIENRLKDLGETYAGKALPSPPMGVTTPAIANAGEGTDEERTQPDSRWISLADAEKISGINRGLISKAVDAGEIKSNGKTGKGKRKVDLLDFTRWQLERANRPEQTESDEKVEKLIRERERNNR